MVNALICVELLVVLGVMGLRDVSRRVGSGLSLPSGS